VFRENAHRAAKIVASGAELELDRILFDPVVEGAAVIVSRPFVEQRTDQVGDALLAGRVLARSDRRNANLVTIASPPGCGDP
jgi:hypothetical protein